MKVKELIQKAHLYSGQKIRLNDHSTKKTYETVDRYNFNIDRDEAERISKLKVCTFEVDIDGLKIWAE